MVSALQRTAAGVSAAVLSAGVAAAGVSAAGAAAGVHVSVGAAAAGVSAGVSAAGAAAGADAGVSAVAAAAGVSEEVGLVVDSRVGIVAVVVEMQVQSVYCLRGVLLVGAVLVLRCTQQQHRTAVVLAQSRQTGHGNGNR